MAGDRKFDDYDPDFDECLRCRRPTPDFEPADVVRTWPTVNDSTGRIMGWTCLGCMTAAEHAIWVAEHAASFPERRAP